MSTRVILNSFGNAWQNYTCAFKAIRSILHRNVFPFSSVLPHLDLLKKHYPRLHRAMFSMIIFYFLYSIGSVNYFSDAVEGSPGRLWSAENFHHEANEILLIFPWQFPTSNVF